MPDLSIIILSYNTKEITKQCLDTLIHNLKLTNTVSTEIIVVDNNSTDGSKELLQSYPVKKLFLSKNVGFGKANNRALKEARGRYTLFLNSDVLHSNVNYDELIPYLDKQKKQIGAATVFVQLSPNTIDPASHRGFPTIWRSFCYFSKLEQTTAHIPFLNAIFGGYHLSHLPLDQEHEVEAISGAYFLAQTALLKKLGGFDEDFFMYGEDLDLCYRINELGYQIQFIPKYCVQHLKYQSGMKNANTIVRTEIKRHFYHSMKIFYQKHYDKQNISLVNAIVYRIIDLLISRV